MTNPFTSGPIAPENNPPIDPQFYQPSRFQISDVTRGVTTVVTTSIDHNYVIGQLVKILIPSTYGIVQLNNQYGYVIAIPASDEVTVDINTSSSALYNNFIASPTFGPTPPSILAIGDINSGIISSTGLNNPTTNIPGSFINISPL